MTVVNTRSDQRHSARICLLSRGLICVIVGAALGTLFWTPGHIFLWVLDVLGRTYLVFLGTVMAHEGVHGHLGRTRSANFWWARLALAPSMVPFTNFQKTHQLHHLHTNVPGKDPDLFIRPRRRGEMLVRALAMPHHWFFWLKRRDRIRRADVVDLLLNYLGIAAVFGIILWLVGPWRLFFGMAPVLVLVSLILWYPFAYKTHEGFSTGAAETRSHDYYGYWTYWFSLGLSMHRVHHLRPQLSWLELYPYVKRVPAGAQGRILARDVVDDQTA